MGAEIYPVFKPRVPGASFDGDGKLLLREFEVLDSMALDLNLTPFSAFGDNRDIPEDFDGDLSELDDLYGEWDEWFSIDDGLKTIDGLIYAIKNHPSMAERLEEPNLIRSDLEDLASCLRVARDDNARFRLQVG